jgi:hypothetical protein
MFFFVAEGTTTSALALLLSAFALCEDRNEGDQEKTTLETKDRRGDLGRESK